MINRRKFIKQTMAAAGGVTMALPAFSNILFQQSKKKLGVALVGLGYYSTDLLAPSLQLTEHCELVGIVTGTPAKAEKWKQQYNLADKNIYNYQNFDSIANNPAIDIIYIVLPPSMHLEYTMRAAKAGKQVWCEKPMAMNETECKSMIDACNQNKVTLSIGYRVHHEPNTQKIIQFRKDLTYGKVLSVDVAAGYFDPRTNHWKQQKKMGGGVMRDMGVYPLNAARYATGLEPIAVTAYASTTRPEIYTEVEETMNFDLEFKDGITAKCEASFGKTIPMTGSAQLIKRSASEYIFSLREDDPRIEKFELRVRISEGGQATARFLPPNTEPALILMRGLRHRATSGGREYLILASVESGNFLILRKKDR